MKKIVKLTESDLYRIIKRVISEQVPQQVPPGLKRKTMDFNWYMKKLNDIFSGMMFVTGIKTMEGYQNLTQSSNLKLYQEKLGKLIAPDLSQDEQIKYGDMFFNGVAYDDRGRRLDRGHFNGNRQSALQNYNEGGNSGKAKRMLLNQIEKNKDTSVPN